MIRQKMVFDNDALNVRRCRAYSEVQSMPEKVTTFPARRKWKVSRRARRYGCPKSL